MEEKLSSLKKLVSDENTPLVVIKDTMKKVVPTYHEPCEINTQVKNARKGMKNYGKMKAIVTNINYKLEEGI